ncbi:carboxymuconolactone decarboxylase family protein [Nonomuraea sp. NPDC049152]|uniref:carboxymuconolactone decarboxylase family protein n=1 Tax=Nonomuraea sp. NPDC049152 TaxID=3154350 RepID=UPI0033E86FFB
MTRLAPEQAPEKSKELLDAIVQRHGGAGEMISTMAHSPALLQGYLELTRAMKRVGLPRTLSEKVSLAVQEWIGCDLCRQAHAGAARAAGLSELDVTLARQGASTDPREGALIAVAVRLLAEPASISDADVAELRHYGWSDRVIADLVGLVTLNLMTRAFSLLAGLEPLEEAA